MRTRVVLVTGNFWKSTSYSFVLPFALPFRCQPTLGAALSAAGVYSFGCCLCLRAKRPTRAAWRYAAPYGHEGLHTDARGGHPNIPGGPKGLSAQRYERCMCMGGTR